jgi:uncharacterized membrane-anchored protein YitT (DUF2179 family)
MGLKAVMTPSSALTDLFPGTPLTSPWFGAHLHDTSDNMSTSVQDYQIAALAAGFTVGFGLLTVWEAIKQTRRNRNPLRSAYIYMLWGEITVNIIIAIIAWLFLNEKLGPR